MKHIQRKTLIMTVALAAVLTAAGCEKLPTPEEEAAIKAEEDAVEAEDDASEDAGGEGEGEGGGGGRRRNPMDSDKNGDGKLAKDEVSGFIADRFDEIDADKDGFITEAEIQERRNQRRGGKGGGGGDAQGETR